MLRGEHARSKQLAAFFPLNTPTQRVFVLKWSKQKAADCFLPVNSLNSSLAPSLQLYNLQICLLYNSFCILASKGNTLTFLVSCYPKKTSILAYLMVFKLQRRLINISTCRLACKNLNHTLHFALRSFTTSAASYLTSSST